MFPLAEIKAMNEHRRLTMSGDQRITNISAQRLFDMVMAGAANLDLNKESINKLNVFPVPDGDTGTNMAMTMQSAAKFVRQVKEPSLENYSAQMAFGAVMGARGNSGVILSQILTGMSVGMKGLTELDAPGFVKALNLGAQYAYKAVTNPMEGTILTVVREAGEALSSQFTEEMDILACLRTYLAAAKVSLDNTPNLLPVLAQAGVVDSGGSGFVTVMEGMLASLEGREIELPDKETSESDDLNDQFNHVFNNLADIIYPYCTEFLIHTTKDDVSADIEKLKANLNPLGDCMLVVGAGSTIKTHIHTDRLSEVIGYAQELGELDDIKINNMRTQNKALIEEQKRKEAETPVKDAILAVANGEGFGRIFRGLGATHIINGGQTMNPSTEDFIEAIDSINAENVYILPNNGNIIMTAQQAAEVRKDKNVSVIPSKSFPQGISALMGYMPDSDFKENTDNMTSGLQTVQSGEITQAVRDTTIDGVDIHENDYMSIADGKIVASVPELAEALIAMVRHAAENDAELVSLYYGKGVDSSAAQGHLEMLSEKFEDLEFELYDGGQNVYDYIISAE